MKDQLQKIDITSSLICALLALIIISIGAAREYTLEGRVLSFFIFLSVVAVGATCTRFNLVGSAATICGLLILDRIDQLKYSESKMHLTPADLLVTPHVCCTFCPRLFAKASEAAGLRNACPLLLALQLYGGWHGFQVLWNR